MREIHVDGPTPWRLCVALLATAFSLTARAAQADPCKAIPDNGPLPAYLTPGRTFQGPVVYVGDGDSLCVAVGPGTDQWVEVRLADFYAAELSALGGREAKSTLERIAKDRQAVCRADHRSYDRIAARCTVGGVSIGDRLRAAGVPEGGNGR